MSTPSPLVFSEVSFGYGSRPVIDNLSLEVKSGELLAIMGGSGVGKTTLLRLMTGLVSATSGSVNAFGQPLTGVSHNDLFAVRRRMGLLFQFGALFTDLSCFENVAFPLREHTSLPDSSLVRWLLA